MAAFDRSARYNKDGQQAKKRLPDSAPSALPGRLSNAWFYCIIVLAISSHRNITVLFSV